MTGRRLTSTAVLALAALTAAPAPASAAECKVELMGATMQHFPCKAELRQRSQTLWQLIVSVGSDKPFDASATVNFKAKPQAGVLYSLGAKPLDFAAVSVVDKHAKRATSWSAGVKKTRDQWDPKGRPLPPPSGSLDVKLDAIGTEPDVHGVVQSNLKPGPMNESKAPVIATFTF